MKLYKCKVTGDEVFIDSKPPGIITETDSFFIIKGTRVARSDKFDDALIGANKSAEDQEEEAADDSVVHGFDLVLDCKWQETFFSTKKEFIAGFKPFVAKLSEKYAEGAERDSFKTRIQGAFKEAVSWFSDIDGFYKTESMDDEGMTIVMKYETKEGDKEECAYFYVFKDGLVSEKL